MVTEPESKALAGAIIELEKQYPSKIDPRALAWVNLIGVLGAVYGTRVAAMFMEAQARKKAGGGAPQRPQPRPAGVTDNPPSPRPADVYDGSPGPQPAAGTTYVKVPDGLVDMDALHAAMRMTQG